MRIIRFTGDDGRIHLGEEKDGGSAEILEGDVFGKLEKTGRITKVGRLLSPIEPTNVLCIGLNYREHARESGMKEPEYPVVFMKPTSSVIGSGEAIEIPACADPAGEVDFECELAVVIGKTALNVSEEDALGYVLGYTGSNDVSARRWQLKRGGGQWVRGKGFDTFCPLGPALVTADEIPDPQGLALRSIVNGEVMQAHTTEDMIFSVGELISFLSQDTTLLPGTVILTGTPQGVGFARKPAVFLKDGDEVVVEIEKIGQLINPVRSKR